MNCKDHAFVKAAEDVLGWCDVAGQAGDFVARRVVKLAALPHLGRGSEREPSGGVWDEAD